MSKASASGKHLALLRLLWVTCRLNPGWSTAVILVTLVMGLIPALQVVLIRSLINAVGGLLAGAAPSPPELNGWFILLAIFFTVPNLVYSLLPIVQGGYREANAEALRLAVLRRTAQLELLQHENPAVQDQLLRVERALSVSIQPWSEGVIWFVQALVMVVALSTVLIQAHWSIWLLAISGGVVHLLVESLIQRNQYQLFSAQTPTQRWEQYLADLLTDFAPRRDLLVFGAGRSILVRWREVMDELREEQWRLQRRSTGISLGGKLIFLAVYLVPLVILVWRYTAGMIDIGLVAGVVSAISGFYAGLTLLVLTSSNWVGQSMHAADIIGFLRPSRTQPPTQPTTQAAGQPEAQAAGVVCTSVSFAYPGTTKPTLSRVNLRIQPGEWVAVVGANGSGKSTFMRLLLGLYQPTVGQVEVDGLPAHENPHRSAVMQEFVRYSLRVRENIGFGHLPQLTDDPALLQAASQAGVELAAADQTPPLERLLGREFGGLELSGGQWQRVALARGELAPAGLVVLDEATSALDPEAESQVLLSLRQHFNGRTVVFVAHRLPSARLADRIIVLDQGQVVEEGSHEALLRQNGRYAEIYRAQASWYQGTAAF